MSIYKCLTTPEYLQQRDYSDNFNNEYSPLLNEYSKKWVIDPIRQWSRVWEYPFVYQEIIDALPKPTSHQNLVLDAGCGVSFFPYYLQSQLNCSILGIDYDSSLADVYDRISKESPNQIDFHASGIDDMPIENETVDVLYSISVLEHTNNYESIIKEWHRVVRPGGHLVLTFDLSVDGLADISVENTEKMLSVLSHYFKPKFTPEVVNLSDILKRPGKEILLCHKLDGIQGIDLPWRFPRLSGAISAIRAGHIPRFRMKRLAVVCLSYREA